MVVRTLLQPFYTAWVIATFLASLLLAFPFFLLISLGNNHRSRRTIAYIVKVWSRGWLVVIGMPMRRVGPRPPHGKYVVVANHISYLDTINIYAAIPGYFRTLAKKEMAAIPVFGFVYKQLVILVDRGSPHSRTRSMRLMWRILRQESSIAIFPEGVFNESGATLSRFYDGAFRLAISAQVPVLPILFPDTVRRWHYSHWWALSPGRNRAVYLPPIPTAGLQDTDLDALKQTVFGQMEVALRDAG